MASVDTDDEARDNHLRTNDFFDIENHPTMTFRSTSIEPDGDDYKLNGDLTIRGVTKPVTFDLEVGGVGKDPWGNTKAGFSATTTINRKDFGMEWNAPLETGGVIVGDKVTIELDIEAALQAMTLRRAQPRRAVGARRPGERGVLHARRSASRSSRQDAGGRAVFLRAGGSDNHHDLGLFSVGDRPSPPPQAPGLYHLAWQVDTIEDLAAVDAELRRRGSLVGATDHGVSKSLYAKDPDGIEFEVMWQVPAEHWYDEHSGMEPLDLAAELERWAGVPTGRLTSADRGGAQRPLERRVGELVAVGLQHAGQRPAGPRTAGRRRARRRAAASGRTTAPARPSAGAARRRACRRARRW